jgi:hypothetical protein
MSLLAFHDNAYTQMDRWTLWFGSPTKMAVISANSHETGGKFRSCIVIERGVLHSGPSFDPSHGH